MIEKKKKKKKKKIITIIILINIYPIKQIFMHPTIQSNQKNIYLSHHSNNQTIKQTKQIIIIIIINNNIISTTTTNSFKIKLELILLIIISFIKYFISDIKKI